MQIQPPKGVLGGNGMCSTNLFDFFCFHECFRSNLRKFRSLYKFEIVFFRRSGSNFPEVEREPLTNLEKVRSFSFLWRSQIFGNNSQRIFICSIFLLPGVLVFEGVSFFVQLRASFLGILALISLRLSKNF